MKVNMLPDTDDNIHSQGVELGESWTNRKNSLD